MKKTVLVTVAGSCLLLSHLLLAAAQTLVLNPLAAAPGRPLPQIHADLADAGESLGAPMVVAYVLVGIAAVVAGWILVRRGYSAFTLTLYYLTALALAMPCYLIISFGAGMALADTYGISGGDHSPWALPLYAVSIGAALTALLLLVSRRPSLRPELGPAQPRPPVDPRPRPTRSHR